MDTQYVKSNATASGTCGENLRWYRLENDLYIEGTGILYGGDLLDWGIDWNTLQKEIRRAVIAEGCTGIDMGAFWDWNALRSIAFPASLTGIGIAKKGQGKDVCVEAWTGDFWDVLSQCPSLEAVSVHEENPLYKTVDGVLFDKEMHTLLVYPQKRAGAYTVPEKVREIGGCAFAECRSLTELTLTENVKVLGDGAIEACSALRSLVIPPSITKIPSTLCHSCTALEEVTIPESVTEIGMMAFYGCRELVFLKIPKTVTEIGENAFKGVGFIFYEGTAWSENHWGAAFLRDYSDILLQ